MLGVQPAHYSVRNISATSFPDHCKKCPWAEAALHNPSPSMLKKLHEKCVTCSNCSGIIPEIKPEYINEKNSYGSKGKVCRNAILIFLYLHTYNPSQNGYISSVSLANMAKEINVCERTIRNCLNMLERADYLFLDYTGDGYFNAIIIDYKNYFLKADKGGRGFIKLSDSVLDSLSGIDSLLTFRLILRQLLESDYTTSCSRTYKELRYSLPNYCKRNIIMKKLADYKDTIYNILIDINTVSFQLKNEYNTSFIIKQEQKENTEYFASLLDELDNFVLSYPTIDKEFVPSRLTRFFTDPQTGQAIKTPVLFQRSNAANISEDLARLAAKYTRNIVEDALADTYRIQMCNQKGIIKNIGAYVLEVIHSYGLIDGLSRTINFSNVNSSLAVI